MTQEMKDTRPLTTGARFHRLAVIGYDHTVPYSHSKRATRTLIHKYKCLCDCGNQVVVGKKDLLSERTKSCGCLRAEVARDKQLSLSDFPGKKKDVRYNMWSNAKRRARQAHLDFTLSIEDIVIPECCPVFGWNFRSGVGKALPESPSLDRIDNSKGYVPENVWVISYKANEIKNRYSLTELKALVSALEKQTGELN